MPFSLSNAWFKYLHCNFLIYTICWEDAHVDRELLKLNNRSKVLMITSAGCNALEYLLDQPALIQCVDINPKQTALLELKLVLFKNSNYKDFFSFFGEGKSNNFQETFSKVKVHLSKESQSIWDNDIEYFNPNGGGFFSYGGSGMFARFLNWSVRKKGLQDGVKELILEKKKDRRALIFNKIEKKLWNGFQKYLWKSPWLLSLAGVPKNQIEAAGDLNEFMREALKNVFIEQSSKTNPYWRLYLEGVYKPEFIPNYLKEENFEFLKAQSQKISFQTSDLISHLTQSRKNYSHFVLLDHMDWLIGKQDEILEKQWQEIITHSEQNAKILFRTAHPSLDFISDKVKEKIEFTQISPEWLSTRDRVGTYTGTYLGVVQ